MWVRGFECARAARSLVCVPCFVLERGVRIPALMSWVSVSCRGSDTRAPCSVSLCERAARVRSAARSLVHVCCVCVVLHAVRVFIGCVHSCYVLCCVARSSCISLAACFYVVMSCVNTQLMSVLISCVFMSCFAHGWWFVLLAMCLCFRLCEHMAFVLVFCVPCALMSIVLTPPILLPDYWLICPTCVYLITLLICSLYNLLVFAVPCWFVVECPWMCRVLSCLAVPCPALPSLPAVLFFPLRGSFSLLFVLFFTNKALLLHNWVLASSLYPNPDKYRL